MSLRTTVDWLVIGAYFVVLFAVVFAHGATNRQNPTEFFLAGSGASGAFPAAQFELSAAFALLLLGWLFVPFYLRSGVFTMPEFLEARYSSGVARRASPIDLAASVRSTTRMRPCRRRSARCATPRARWRRS